MNVTFIGCGNVGAPLADHLQHLGHAVTLAARDPQSEAVRQAQARNPAVKAVPMAQAVHEAEVVFLATPFAANERGVPPLAQALAGKVHDAALGTDGAGHGSLAAPRVGGADALNETVRTR